MKDAKFGVEDTGVHCESRLGEQYMRFVVANLLGLFVEYSPHATAAQKERAKTLAKAVRVDPRPISRVSGTVERALALLNEVTCEQETRFDVDPVSGNLILSAQEVKS